MSSEDNHIRIFDTTLRDGEQSPGATMTLDEKIRVAELLDDMGVDIIEAGSPLLQTVTLKLYPKIAERSQNSIIAGLARAIQKDIDRTAGEAVKKQKR